MNKIKVAHYRKDIMSELKDGNQLRVEGFTRKTIRISYNYCGICGHVPGKNDAPNYAPLRWWDADDGWKIGTLCHWCHDEVCNAKPKPGDYAFTATNGVCDDSNTDEDESLALL